MGYSELENELLKLRQEIHSLKTKGIYVTEDFTVQVPEDSLILAWGITAVDGVRIIPKRYYVFTD